MDSIIETLYINLSRPQAPDDPELEKAKAEYKRYQAQTLSPVEEEYLKTIKQLGKTAKTEAEKQDDSSDPS